jgi:hypothetical protein
MVNTREWGFTEREAYLRDPFEANLVPDSVCTPELIRCPQGKKSDHLRDSGSDRADTSIDIEVPYDGSAHDWMYW